jgi:uncharacterized Zn finger protein (UPF0148 family)
MAVFSPMNFGYPTEVKMYGNRSCPECTYRERVYHEKMKEKKSMNVVKRLKTLSLSKEDKLLRKYQIVDDTGDLTGNGKEALWNILLEDNKTALVEKLSELEKSEKAKKA